VDWERERVAVEERLRAICLALPEAREGPAWNGCSWLIRKNHFCQVFTVDESEGQRGVIYLRSQPPELDALVEAGYPFFKAAWGKRVVGMAIDDTVDWDEVSELIAESYCIQAPRKLVALLRGGLR
jgi:predicted DNA-binding protein (MmcQ/YjbR family)